MLARLGPEMVDLEMGGQVVASQIPAAVGDADGADASTEVSRRLDKDPWFRQVNPQA